MTTTLRNVLTRTDWALLAKQKQRLLETADDEILIGVVHFIDAIQDAAHSEGFPVVWLTENNDDEK